MPALSVPPAQVHPLPPSLMQWNTAQAAQGDYFDQVKSTAVGGLIWTHWPVKVYVVPSSTPGLPPERWSAAIAQAVQDWQPYLPLALTTTGAEADISISPVPPQGRSGNRVRSAETRYELYVDAQQTLAHRISIYIRPSQTPQYLTAAARHELGHALGIWGHSPNPNDTMYFAQVRQPPAISVRDINTLKRVYEQPTQLGWPLKPNPESTPAQG
ncbi:MAG TPA: matrixin family metalloprotease [Stenomitos sp.]